MQDIINPIDRALLKAELTKEKRLRSTNKSKNEIYIVTAHDSPNVMQEIGRLREVATIKVLGFYRKETGAYVFRENIMLTILGMAVGLALGHFLHLFFMNEIRVDLISFHIYVKPASFLYSALLTLAFAWCVNKTMGGKLERISMTESLKSVD